MTARQTPKKIALVGDYLPRKCGIATFSHDVCHSIRSQYADIECLVIPVNDLPAGYDYPEEVRFEINEQDLASYERAAEFLNFGDTEVISLQHEFGIYGGTAGGHILTLLRNTHIPVVTTLHTILEHPNADQRRVFDEVCKLSARLVVMTDRSVRMLREIYEVPEAKIDLIPHGIPDMPFVDPNFFKDQFGVEGKRVLLTFGLLSPNKGVEDAIRALPDIVREFPDVVYIVLGATHPNLVREQGENYRCTLERLVVDLGMDEHVVFYNRFVTAEELKEFLSVADIYVTPYQNSDQIVSGALVYAFGCGNAVISTPYWHAAELLADGRGVLVPFRDSAALAREVIALLRDEVRRHAMRKRAYLMGREMIWSHVAHLYVGSFQKARRARVDRTARRFALKTLQQERLKLPTLCLDHLRRMTDSTGLLEHAALSVPNYREGYCTDDNARALLLMVLLEQTGNHTPELQLLASRYAGFVNHAFDPELRRFSNILGYDRCWRDDQPTDDAHGRVLWALGVCVGRSQHRSLQMWAAQLFERVLLSIADTTSMRAWASALVGLTEYSRRLSGDRLVNQLGETLTQRLLDGFRHHSDAEWTWFEPVLTYDNARLPHALLVRGRLASNAEAMDVGLRSLRWLTTVQTNKTGHFQPIGSNGFYPRNGKRAQFDQQPIEAYATLAAALEAFACTQDAFWLTEAQKAFEWFLGRNDLNQSLYDPATGGCCDGLHIDRLNLNQGAESTLSFLLALQEMRLASDALGSLTLPVPIQKSAPPPPALAAVS